MDLTCIFTVYLLKPNKTFHDCFILCVHWFRCYQTFTVLPILDILHSHCQNNRQNDGFMSLFCRERMFRKTAWSNTVSDAVSFHQDQALSTTIFLLKSYGPTGFMLREEGEARNFKINHSVSQDGYLSNSQKCFLSKLPLFLLFVLLRFAWVTHIHALVLYSPRSRSHANTSAGISNTQARFFYTDILLVCKTG